MLVQPVEQSRAELPSLLCLFSKHNPGLWAFFHQDFQGKCTRCCHSWSVGTAVPGRTHQKVLEQRFRSAASHIGNAFCFFIFCKTL